MKRAVIFCLTVLTLTGCLDSKENKLQRFLAQGNDMAEKRSYGESKRYYHEAIKIDSCFVDAWNNLGTVYFMEKHFPEALDAYNNALQCDPKVRQILLNRSNTFYELGKYELALKDIDRYASLGNDTLVTHLSRGSILSRMNQFEKAISEFKKALVIDAAHVETIVNLGTVYYYRREYDSAKFFLEKAIAYDANEANAYNAYALVELDQNHLQEAERRVNQALALKRDDPYFLNNRGYILLMKGDYPNGLADIDRSISEDPYNAWAYRNKAVYYMKINQLESALRLLKKTEQMDTTVAKLFYYLGEANILNKNAVEGCRYLKKSFGKGELSMEEFNKKCKR